MISKDKQYKTRDGREVRIYATDGWGEQPVQGAIRDGDKWKLHTWHMDGMFGYDCAFESAADLIEVKPRIKRTFWINLYPDRTCADRLHITKEYADIAADPKVKRLACVKVEIDCEEGEGL